MDDPIKGLEAAFHTTTDEEIRQSLTSFAENVGHLYNELLTNGVDYEVAAKITETYGVTRVLPY